MINIIMNIRIIQLVECNIGFIIKRKFRISYKLMNPNETQTICAIIGLLKSLFKINLEKKEINSLIKDFLYY